MIKKAFFLYILFLLPIYCFSQTPITFEKALEQKIIYIKTCIGNDKSCHYIKPLFITFQNRTNTTQTIIINAGIYFVSEPVDYQDITVTRDYVITFKPRESKNLNIIGVCTEPSNKAPHGKVRYSLGKVPKPEYVEFARFVAKEKLYGTSEAQSGMWFLCRDKSERTDEDLLDMIVGITGESVYRKIIDKLAQMHDFKLRIEHNKKKDEVNDRYIYHTKYYNGTKLIKEVANTDKILGEKKYQVMVDGKKYSEYSFELTESNPKPSCEMSGRSLIVIGKSASIRIGMFDKNHVLVREIYYNSAVQPGRHTVNYAYDCEAYSDRIYHFKTIMNGQIVTKSTLMRK